MSGVPCFAELDVDDPDAAAGFYAAVLGWTGDHAVLADHQHRVLRHDGVAVAALGSPGAATPPAWTLYLAVDDVDAAVQAAEELGGQVLHEPEDDRTGGRLAVVLDAGAAVVGLWESDDPVPDPAPGRLCWARAASAEPGTTRTFYRELLGWRWVEDGAPGRLVGHGPDGPLAELALAGDALPHWLPVFGVGDVDAAVGAAWSAGGSVLARDDSRATLADAAGATFEVCRLR